MDNILSTLGIIWLIIIIIALIRITSYNKTYMDVEEDSWVANNDGYGTSYTCKICGHHEFYQDKVPPPCLHNPSKYEIKMHIDRVARQAEHKSRIESQRR